jgi:hypothetical protein
MLFEIFSPQPFPADYLTIADYLGILGLLGMWFGLILFVTKWLSKDE